MKDESIEGHHVLGRHSNHSSLDYYQEVSTSIVKSWQDGIAVFLKMLSHQMQSTILDMNQTFWYCMILYKMKYADVVPDFILNADCCYSTESFNTLSGPVDRIFAGRHSRRSEFMQTHSRRTFPRKQYEAPIQYVYLQPDRFYNSRMYNFSEGGFYFEPFQPLEINSQINIVMPNYSPDADGPEAYQSYLAVIRWCQKRPGAKSSQFGAGAEIIERSHERFAGIETQKRQSCDLCGKSLPAASVCRIDGSICVCPNCFNRLDKMPEGQVKSSIKRFLDGNVL